MRSAIGMALTLALLAACDAAPPAAAPTTPTAPTAPTTGPPRTLAAGEECPVTRPTRFEPPPGVSAGQLFGAATSHGNGKIWVGGLGPDGLLEVGPDFVEQDGSIRWKLGWWREVPGELTITGRRLDGPAPALRSGVPAGYGDRGFQASGVDFPTEGCWEVTGSVGQDALTFVLRVRKLSP